MHVQKSIGSRNSAIHNDYHTSLRPSSMLEPRYPSLKVVVLASVGLLASTGHSTSVSEPAATAANVVVSLATFALPPSSFHMREMAREEPTSPHRSSQRRFTFGW